MKTRQRRHAHEPENGGAKNDETATFAQKPVERRQRPIADRLRFARRANELQERRQQRDAEAERDDHTAARDQTEFGNARIACRHEGIKAGGRCRGGERQRIAEAAPGMRKRGMQIIDQMPFGAVAHAELDAEIDSQSDEQRDEGDGNNVEGADGEKAQPCRNRQPDQYGEQDREDQPNTAHRQPKHGKHPDQHQRDREQRPFLDRAEFLVRHRNRTGQPHLDAFIGRQVQKANKRTNNVGGAISRRERLEIEVGLRFDEFACFEQRRPLAGYQRLPGQKGRLARGRPGKRVLEGRDRPFERLKFRLPALDAFERRRKAVHDAAQARIRRQGAEKRLCRDQLLGGGPDLLDRKEQQTFARKKIAATRRAHIVKEAGTVLERRRQFGRAAFGKFGRRAIDNDIDRVAQLGKFGIERQVSLAPAGLGGNQRFRIAVHGEMPGDVEAA